MKITLFLIFLVTLEIILSGCTKNPVIPTPNDDPYPMFVDRDFSKVELNRTRIVNISHFPKSDLENTIDLENISGIIYQSIFNASKNKPWTLAIDDLSQKKRLFLYQGKRKIQSISGDDNGTSLLVSMVGESTIKAQTQVFRIDLANNSLTLLY